ncbi:hypothetical protein [Streptomyces sp. HM190]|uniref:hypothetical protein n=1 Tax=Streptomyces sp. HM190 TaxID=2695266 RepID=UPI001F2E5A2A|nr:hypothetical protein [Streptomyces sp. HM190]
MPVPRTQGPRPGVRARHGRPAPAAVLAALLPLLCLVTASPAPALSGDLRMHDPSVIKAGNCYYGFSTGFENDAFNPSGSITMDGAGTSGERVDDPAGIVRHGAGCTVER